MLIYVVCQLNIFGNRTNTYFLQAEKERMVLDIKVKLQVCSLCFIGNLFKCTFELGLMFVTYINI